MAESLSVPPRSRTARGFPGSPVRVAAVGLALAAGVFLCALISIKLSRESGSLAIIWLPNAMMVGIFWALRSKLLLLLLPLTIGVAVANLAYGDTPLLALLLGAVNGVEVFLACAAVERVLRHDSPHGSYLRYLKFVGAVCVAPALVAGALGATVLAGFYAAPWSNVFVSWALGDMTSMLAFAPFFYLAVQAVSPDRRPSRDECRKFVICFCCLALCLLVPAITAMDGAHFVLAAPVLAIFALWLRAETVISVTAAFLMLLGLLVYFDRTLFAGSFRFGDSQLLFVLALGCMVVPGNLIASVVSALRVAERRAREVSQLKSEFLSTMSHEIRTPLNAIMGMFQLIERGEVPARQKTQAQAGHKAATNLLKLLSDVLEMSRLEAKSVELWCRECDLGEMLSEWRAMAEAAIERSGKTIAFSIDLAAGTPGSAWVDDGRLGQIIHNLVDNAVRFTDEGSISIEVSHRSDALRDSLQSLEILVTDTGCGIAEDKLDTIFDRFRQTDGSIKRKAGGTGLGLAISKDLVQLMGGTLSADSRLGQGTTFRLAIPLHGSRNWM